MNQKSKRIMRNVDLVFILKQKLSDRCSTKFTFWRSYKEIFICGIFLFFIKYMGSIFSFPYLETSEISVSFM